MQSIPGGVKWIFYTGHCNEMMPANHCILPLWPLNVSVYSQCRQQDKQDKQVYVCQMLKCSNFFFPGCFLGVLSRVTVIVTDRFLQILLSWFSLMFRENLFIFDLSHLVISVTRLNTQEQHRVTSCVMMPLFRETDTQPKASLSLRHRRRPWQVTHHLNVALF